MLNPTPVIKSQVLHRISQAPAAKVWAPVDFIDLGGRDAVDKTLQCMVADVLTDIRANETRDFRLQGVRAGTRTGSDLPVSYAF